MQTACARCQKIIDTVQGYKFGPNQYLCMPCYDQFKAERLAKTKKQQQPNKEALKPVQPPTTPPPQHKQTTPQMFQPKTAPRPPQPPVREPVHSPLPAAAPEKAAPQAKPAVETCDVCKKPLDGFKFPLKGGRKVCSDCNNLLRDVAKSLILNIHCPHCGKEIQLSQD